MATSYTDILSTGDRRSLINITSNLTFAGSGQTTPNILVDGNLTTQNLYLTAQSVIGKYLTFDFKTAIFMDEAKFIQYAGSYSHGTWRWEGSSDNTNWNVIGGDFTLGGSATQTMTTLNANSRNYRYYRIFGVSGTTDSTPYLYEFQFKIGIQPNKTLISLSNGEVKYLGGGSPATGNISVIPKMISNTLPSGVASASSTTSTAGEYKAFDTDSASYWQTQVTGNDWIQYKFINPIAITKYSIKNDAVNLTAPKTWTFEGSNDGVNYTVLDTRTNVTGFQDNVKMEFTITNTFSYLYYRLLITAHNGVSGSNPVRINELEMFVQGTPATPPSWKTLTSSTPTKSQFETYGMDDLSVIPPEQWSDLLLLDSDIKLLTYVPIGNVTNKVGVTRKEKGISMNALPQGQLIANQKYIKTYGSINQTIVKEFNNTGKNRGVIKIVMSFSDNVWYYYSKKDNSFKIVNLTESNVKQFGNTLEEISSISQARFDTVNSRSQIKFSYYIEEDIRDKTSAMVDYTELKQEAVFSSPEISNMSLYILNTVSTIDMNLIGRELIGTISDIDSTKVRYKVFLNGVQYYPKTGYTEFAPSPLFLSLNLDGQYINMGVLNTVAVEFQDYWGATETWSMPFIGEYYGLIFEDPLSNAYATDIGQVLKYLDIGTLIAGQKSTEYEIKLHNTNGYSVGNPTITSYSEQSGVSFELSKTQSPFVGEEKLTFNQTLLDGESVSFFLRVVTKLDTPPKMGGMFELRVNADKI